MRGDRQDNLLIIITVLIGSVIVLSGMAIPSNVDILIDKISGGFYTILLSIGCSIIASAIFTWLISRIDKNREENIIDELKEMRDIVSQNRIVMRDMDRKKLLNTGFYDNLYNRADEIGICGIQLSAVINYICQSSSSRNTSHWVKKLYYKEGVKVFLVIPYPVESNCPTQKCLDQLKAFEQSLRRKRQNKLAERSSIRVFLTETPICFSLSYSHTINDREHDIMLFALLVNGNDQGPIYEIRRSLANTYDELKKHLESLAENGRLVFQWDENGIQYYEL